jgi:hypothetical protein
MNDPRTTKKNLPRHAAGSFELKEGTGPITAMCTCGSFLEIYKQDKTFRVQTPESIDPDETNPNAPWVTSPVSDVGSSNPIVARVLLQGHEILKTAGFDDHVNKEAVTIHLHGCKESLLACEKIARRVAANIDCIVTQVTENAISKDNHGRGLYPFPQVQDLDTDCGTFLIQANRTIKKICELPQHFYPLAKTDSNFDHLSKRLAESVGEESPLTVFVRENCDGVRYLIDLRNFHEHPKQLQTVIENFRVLPDGRIQVPMWHLAGAKPTEAHPIREEMAATIDFLRDMAEAMLIHLVMQRVSRRLPYIVEETPDDKLDSRLPIKYRLSLDISRLTLGK